VVKSNKLKGEEFTAKGEMAVEETNYIPFF
jgi:hypothetical protein